MPLIPNTLEMQLQPVIMAAYIKAKQETMPQSTGPDDADIVAFSTAKMTEAVSKEAKAFADELSKGLSTIITNYIKTMSINCIVSIPLTVATPVGPGTAVGTIPPTSFTIS